MTEVAVPVNVVKTETIVQESVETEPVPVGGVIVQESNGVNGTTEKTNGTSPTAVVTNGAAKKKEQPKAEQEPPQDPRVNPVGWLKQQIKPVVHKVNYYLLDYAEKMVGAGDETKVRQPLPGKNESVTKNQFLSHVQDGTLLAHLANKLSPGSVETIHEGEAAKEKPNRVANLQAFIHFAKTKAGLPEDQVFTVEDLLEKGKAGFEPVFNTLFRIAISAQEKFNQAAIDLDRITDDAKNTMQNSFLQSILNFFKRHTPSSSGKQVAQQKAADETIPTTNGNAAAVATTNNNSDKVIEEVQEQVNKVEVSSSPPAAVVVSEPVATAAN